jgi:expansin (peptidoglycan-binding protein)
VRLSVAPVFVLVLVAACGGTGDDQQALDGGPIVGGSCSAVPADESGDGTYYAADGTGNCSFAPSPNDLLVAAMNRPDYGNAVWCGACVDVTGPKGSVTVRIVDQCPGCLKGSLDLSPQAFDMIADHAAGRVAITWHEVACPVTGPIGYYFKAGDMQFYAAIQIRNARYPIAKLEVMHAGAYLELVRADYNFFISPSGGLGIGPLSFRVTDQRGHVLEDAAIALGSDVTRDGASQFEACP